LTVIFLAYNDIYNPILLLYDTFAIYLLGICQLRFSHL